MATVGPNSAGTGATVALAGSSFNWSSEGNIVSSNNIYATATSSGTSSAYSNYLVAKNFGFALNSAHAVTSILIEYECKVTAQRAASGDHVLDYTLNGTTPAGQPSANGLFPLVEGYKSYAKTVSLTGSQVNDASFGIMLFVSGDGSGNIYSLDHLRITLTYTPLTISTTAIESGVKDMAYSQTLLESAGTASWSVTAGALPTGLSLAAATGVISGTPTVVESQTFTVTADWGGGFTDTQELTIRILDVMTDLVSSVTETISKETSTFPYVVANNNQAYVLNLRTQAWSFIDTAPYSKVIYRPEQQTMIASRRDTGNICTLDADVDDYTITWTLKTGFYSLSKFDELKALPDEAAQALKRVRRLYTEVRSTGNITLTIFTEQDSTGQAFTITPTTTDYVVYNMVRTRLSRDVRGKSLAFQFSGTCRAWIGETSIMIAPRALR